MNMRKVTAVFPAAGQGKRMHLPVNKAFLDLDGKSMLVRTLLKFSAAESIDYLIVVVAADEINTTQEMLKNESGLKPYVVRTGGSERQYSIYNGLKLLPDETEIVLVHDAARPFVSAKTIDEVTAAARKYGGAIAAVPEKNTVKIVDEENRVTATPPRQKLWEVQTPQGFRKDIIMAAYEKAAAENFLGTDDASLAERLGADVRVVMSDYRNIKITTPEDAIIAAAFLREEKSKIKGSK